MKTVGEYTAKPLTFEFTRGVTTTRLRELMLYIAEKSKGDDHCGVIKLNKILYWSDFANYAVYGESITGNAYIHRVRGPVPQNLYSVRSAMVADGDIELQSIPIGNKTQKRIIAKRLPKLNTFKPTELAMVDDVIQMLRGINATEASEMSHGLAWSITPEGEPIAYEYSFLSDEGVTDDDTLAAERLLSEMERAA